MIEKYKWPESFNMTKEELEERNWIREPNWGTEIIRDYDRTKKELENTRKEAE